jgi:hypothetical protein
MNHIFTAAKRVMSTLILNNKKVFSGINSNFTAYSKKIYKVYDYIIATFDLYLKEIVRILKILVDFLSNLYLIFNSFFSITSLIKLAIQLYFVAQFVINIPAFPVSDEIKEFLSTYVNLATSFYISVTGIVHSVAEYFRLNSSVFVENGFLKDNIKKLEEEISVLKDQKEGELAIFTSQVEHFQNENSKLRSLVTIEQEKANSLSVINKDLTSKLQDQRLLTQFDKVSKYLSIIAGAATLTTSVMNFSFNVYRFATGDTNASIIQLKDSVKVLTSIILGMKKQEVVQTAEERAASDTSSGRPVGLAPSGSASLSDMDVLE